jgi:mono/diheme cytochrome c family protein
MASRPAILEFLRAANMNILPPRLPVRLVIAAFALACVGLVVSPSMGQVEPRRDTPGLEKVDYLRSVKPVLTRHCVLCHGAEKTRGGLRLDTARAARKGGKGGPAIVEGRSDESLLIAAVLGDGPGERMPLNRPPLSQAEIDLLRAWIDQGAPYPRDELPVAAVPPTHWAFVPPGRPAIPTPRGLCWTENPIDCFLLARLEREGIRPSDQADRPTLLRRVSLDLIGLPPAPDELAAFLADPRPDAYDRVVDRLLASPHFGERWGRLWLDQARYADSNGFNIDAPRSIWKYRDWVIDAINRDVPFDAFTIDQIAGDLRPDASFSHRIATGFHRNTQINQEGGIDVEQFRIESIVDRVNTTGTVFLGLTVGCAQCHDHKYDPVSQREYYRLFAFFNNVDEPDLEIASSRELAQRDRIRGQIDEFHRDLAVKYPDLHERERRWEATVDLAFKQAQNPVARVAFDAPRTRRTPEQTRALVELMVANEPAYKDDFRTLAKLQSSEPRFVTTMVVRERAKDPRGTHVHLGGDFTRKGDAVTPGTPAIFSPVEDMSPGTPADRMDLARWLVDRRNPLTARVAVNRIWQADFGRGLVESDNDFGTQGSPPSHPELLDWLACELMDSGWSVKHIHRLIVTSAAYRQWSRVRPDGRAVDPDNRLLWRQSRSRLDAELIRDTALKCSGLLAERIGGPSVFPPQPDGVMTLGQMRREWQTSAGPDRFRRGIYTYFWRATPFPFLTTFDAPGGIQACTRRLRSNTPLQALTLLNDPAMIEIARGLADRIRRDCPGPPSDRDRIEHAFKLCLGRPPTDSERAALARLLDRERADGCGRGDEGEKVDLGAWIAVARVLLNLDEFVTRE